jgi:hypothetical protein
MENVASSNRQAMVQRCTTCLMPDTYPGIECDSAGVCNQCRDFKKKELLGEEAFIRLLGSQKGERYDCVLGISGGKDSCYVAYLAKKRFNLRAMAVCYDFPFLCDLARRNIERVCDSLALELVVVKSKGDLEYKLLRNHLLSVAATKTSWGQCIFCHYGIEAILYNVAAERKIPFILGGITKYELWNPGSRTRFLLQRVKKLPVKDAAKFLVYQAKAFSLLVDQRRQFRIPGNNALDVYRRARPPENGPRSVDVFDYIRWDQRVIEKTLKEETGWVKPDKSISWRYDCSLEPFLDYTYKKEFGISTVGLYLSNLIRDGLMTRDEGLGILEKSEDDEMLREKLESVFEFLKIPSASRTQFFSDASSR